MVGIMYLATLNAENYEFMTLASSPELAMQLLQAACYKHRDKFSYEYDWSEFEPNVFCTFIRQGDILRNGVLIHSYDTAAGWFI